MRSLLSTNWQRTLKSWGASASKCIIPLCVCTIPLLETLPSTFCLSKVNCSFLSWTALRKSTEDASLETWGSLQPPVPTLTVIMWIELPLSHQSSNCWGVGSFLGFTNSINLPCSSSDGLFLSFSYQLPCREALWNIFTYFLAHDPVWLLSYK